MLSILNELLKKLPANGYKTIIGTIITGFYYLFPDFPKEQIGQAGELLSQIFGIGGQLYLVLGVLHKWVKTKF